MAGAEGGWICQRVFVLVGTANPVQSSPEGVGISSWATGSGSSKAVLKPRGMVGKLFRGGEGGEERRVEEERRRRAGHWGRWNLRGFTRCYQDSVVRSILHVG